MCPTITLKPTEVEVRVVQEPSKTRDLVRIRQTLYLDGKPFTTVVSNSVGMAAVVRQEWIDFWCNQPSVKSMRCESLLKGDYHVC